MNKLNQPKINMEQPAELTLNLGTGMEHFVIAGDAEAVLPLAEQAQAYDKANEARRGRVSHVSKHIGSTMLEAPKMAVSGLVGRVGLDIKAKTFDVMNGTDLYGALQQKRKDERVLSMATSLGLVGVTHCAKHERAIAQLKRIV